LFQPGPTLGSGWRFLRYMISGTASQSPRLREQGAPGVEGAEIDIDFLIKVYENT
jgi:hypothetical protein